MHAPHRRHFISMGGLFLAACASDGATAPASDGLLRAMPRAEGAQGAPGLHRFHAGTSALLYVPKNLGATPAPFLMLLHGAGGRGEQMIRRFRTEAERRAIILFAPDAAGETWDAVIAAGRGRTPAFGQDVARIDAALAEAFARVRVDPMRLGVAGFSDGASYALSLGARNSARFSGIFGFSPGLIVPGDADPPRKVVITHGEQDRVLPLSVSRDTLAPMLRAAGFEVELVVFSGGHELPDGVLAQALEGWVATG
jgi:phospholipase/carboxylesterase